MFRRILDTVSQAADKVVGNVSDAYDATKGTVSSAGGLVADAFDATRNTVSDAAGKVSDVVSDAYEATRNTVVDAADKVADVAVDAYGVTRNTVSDAADKVGDAACDAYGATRSTVSSAADVVADVVSDAYSSTRDIVSSGFDGSRDYVSNLGSSMSTFWAARKNRESSNAGKSASSGDEREKILSLEREKRFESALEKAAARIKDNDGYFRMLIAMQAVAQACAACDGEVSHDEQEQIDELILGMGAKWLPPQVRTALDALISQPPSLQEAFAIASQVGADAQDLFQEIVRFVIYLDDQANDAEQQFLAHWVQLRASA